MRSVAKKRESVDAFTLWELLAALLLVLILAYLGFRILHPHSHEPAWKAYCQNHLKQIGFAFVSFANDHQQKFPLEIAVSKGGSMEWKNDSLQGAQRTFLAMSNYLINPVILTCPDMKIKPAKEWDKFTPENLAYFIEATAIPTRPNSILSGDANIAANGRLLPQLVRFETNTTHYWTNRTHYSSGNLLQSDGTVFGDHKQLNMIIKRSFTPPSYSIPE